MFYDQTRFRNANFALKAHANARGEEYKVCRDTLVNMLVDLQYFSDGSALSFDNALKIAREHRRAERKE